MSTFNSLSTALARSPSRRAEEDSRGEAYLAMILGPSVGAAKAKVIFAIEDLEVKEWGSSGSSKQQEESGAGGTVEEQGPEDGVGDESLDNQSDEEGDSFSSGSDGSSLESSGSECDSVSDSGSDSEESETESVSDSTTSSEFPDPPEPDAEPPQDLQKASRLLARILASHCPPGITEGSAMYLSEDLSESSLLSIPPSLIE